MSTGSFAAGLVGVVLDGKYRLDAVLGEGGMGSVFRAQHLPTDRRVAVKLLKPHLTQDHAASQRFMREARATLKVESPHAVKVLDFGITPQRDYYMALEYLDGRTVQRELEIDGPFAPTRVLHIARQALHALGAAHKIGLVHRDIKPDNILLMRVGDDPDYAKLLDFGVAKLMEGAAVGDNSRLALTAAGMVFGTPEFMSPEQACGHVLDGRSDLYSLAATMFAMLTGCALYDSKTAIEWLTHHARTPPPHLDALQPQLAQYPKLDELLQRCLAKHRDQRPTSAGELDQLLAQLEVYVKRGGAAAPRPANAFKGTMLSTSAYVQALPPETVEPGETLLPPQRDSVPPTDRSQALPLRPASLPGLAPSYTDVASAVPAPHGRGLYLALGGIVILAMIGIAIGIAMKKAGAPRPADAPTIARTTSDAAVVLEAQPAAVIDAGARTDSGVTSVDASVVKHVDAGVTRPARDAKHNSARELAAAHLKNAEQALRANNRLRQLAEAHLALEADPKNARARYLLADALMKSQDLERGCAHLRALGRYPLAIARANAENCP